MEKKLPWRAPSSRIQNIVLLSVELAHNSAVGVSGRISATGTVVDKCGRVLNKKEKKRNWCQCMSCLVV